MYIKSFQRILEDVGDMNIQGINVCREPLSKAIMTLLDITSGNEFSKNLKKTPYDRLYHLFLEITIDNRVFVLEKNDVLHLTASNDTPRSNTLKVAIRDGMTLGECLVKTHDLMGGKFFTYKAQDNNCQYFANKFLEANGLSTKETKEFILQDVASLFDKDTRFRKLVNSVTGLGKNISENENIDKAIEKFKSTEPVFNKLVRNLKTSSEKISNSFRKIKL